MVYGIHGNRRTRCGVHINKVISKSSKKSKKELLNYFKKIPYKDRLMHLKLPNLKYRRLRGDMIEVFKITHNYTIQKYHSSSDTILNLILEVINTNYSIIRFTTIHESILFLHV